MAATLDSLTALRQAVSSGSLDTIKLQIKTSESEEAQPTSEIAAATEVIFNSQPFSLSAATRFISKDVPIDLRSILFAYQTKDDALPDYIDQARVKGLSNLPFVERLDLIAWLEGSADSEYIKPLAGDTQAAEGAAAAATGAPVTVPKGDRLGGIYKHERRLGDRNSILRGIKPTDFSHVKKTAEILLRKEKPKPGSTSKSSVAIPAGSLPTHPKKPNRRPDPIILLSPSASSLLRMSNVKTFLADGAYTPPDSNSGVGSLNHITRVLPAIDANRPLRFILVEGPDRFKPDDWNHVVAVFTTGQAWQFKGYRWTEPSDLFAHVLGIYVGWKGDAPPASVRGWGRGVRNVELDKWTGVEQGRWRDREVVEKLWGEIQEHMKRRGWGRDTGPR